MLKKLYLISLLCLNTLAIDSLTFVKKRKELVIATKNSPTTYYIDKDGKEAGIDYDLGKIIANRLGVLPRFVVKDTIHEILVSLKGGESDIALAGLSRTQKREREFILSRNYQSIKQQLVCHKKFIIKNLDRLSKVSITVPKSTSYVQTLSELQKKYPKIKFKEDKELNSDDLLEKVYLDELDCTIADSNIVAVNLREHPELKIQKSFDYEGLVAMMPKTHSSVAIEVDKIISSLLKSGELSKIEHKYYDHIKNFDYYDLKVFKRRMKKALKKYEDIFKSAAKKYDLDWRLLAAISYQESHWKPKAKSPTGVRGMMMLTRSTAKAMGVKNRLNVKESIYGGAKYIRKLIDRMPPYIKNPDRSWMALASYNVGFYHLRDARSLTVWQNKNPNIWKDVSETLPLLTKKKYYKRLQYGYARGREPVTYVKRIREYLAILRQEKSK